MSNDIELLQRQVSEWRAEIGRLQVLVAFATKDSAKPAINDIEAERRMFEDWFAPDIKYIRSIKRDGEGYKLLQAHTAWRAWKARAIIGPAAPPPASPVLSDEEIDLAFDALDGTKIISGNDPAEWNRQIRRAHVRALFAKVRE